MELGPDVTPPNTDILTGPANPTIETVATFTFEGTDNRPFDLTFQCALDGTAYNSCVSPQQFSDLTRGMHTLLVRARDAAGNWDPTPDSYTWQVKAPPLTTIFSGPAPNNDITESTSATFTFAANVPGSTYWCWLDGVLDQNCTSPKSYENLARGAHEFAVLARDPDGIWELQWAEYEWTIGYVNAPITLIETGPDVTSESSTATFTFSTTATDPDVFFMCSLNGADPQQCESPYTIDGLVPGELVFEVYATHPTFLDIHGEAVEPFYEPVVSTYQWTVIDVTPPDTAITYGPRATTGSPNAYFGMVTNEGTAEIQCSLDFQGFGSCESPAVFEDLLPGEHVLHARAVDLALNVDPTPAEHRWTIVRPAANTPVGSNVELLLPIDGGAGPAKLTFFQVSMSGATGLDELNGGPPIALPGYGGGRFFDLHTTAEYGEPVTLCVPYNPADYAEGPARLIAYDGAEWSDITLKNDFINGEVCAVPEDFGLIALAHGSEVAPLVHILSAPPILSETGKATFHFAPDVPGSMLHCSIDGLPFTMCESPMTYTHLQTGDHKFEVQAFGPLGGVNPYLPTLYEWEVALGLDTTPPDTQIVKGPPSVSASSVIQLEFTGEDDQTLDIELEYECLLDGILVGSCSSILSTPTTPGVPYEIELLEGAYGRHTVQVRAIDEMGNVDPTPATRTWTYVDVNSPDTSIDIGPEEETEGTVAIFEFTGEDFHGNMLFDFECSLDGEDFKPCVSPVTVEGLAIGPHVFQVRAVSPSGVVDSTPEWYEWLIIPPLDTDPPDTFIVDAPTTSGPDILFGLQSDELLVEEYECSLDGAQFESCNSLVELTGLASGEHTLEARAVDYYMNVDPTPAVHRWTAVGEPDTIIISGPPELSASRSATITFKSDQPNATFQCSFNGSLFAPCTSPYVVGPLSNEMQYEVVVQAMNEFRYIDNERVMDQDPAVHEWEVLDLEPPDTILVSAVRLGPEDLIEPDSYRFELSGSDNGTVFFELEFECSIDAGPWESCDWPFHYLPIEELAGGNHEIRFRAMDEFDNVDPTPAVYNFTTEAGPETTIVGGPPLETGNTQATFTFAANPAEGATFECSLDLGLFEPCPNPYTITVPLGEHELEVRAKGPLGAVDLEPEVYSWVVGDVTAPVITIHTGPAVATTSMSATFTFTVDDPNAFALCSLDGAPPTFCESPVTYDVADLALASGSAGGPHSFTVTADKLHLLAEPVAAEWLWTVDDETAPETSIASAPPAEISAEVPSVFRFASPEPGVSFECALDPVGGPLWSGCASPPLNRAEFAGLEPGSHTLLVRAIDPALNADATPVSFTWTVLGPALTTITANVPSNLNGATTTSTSATLSWTSNQTAVSYMCSLDGAELAPCTSPVTHTHLTLGDHTLEVQSTNKFGLLEAPPASYEWTIALPEGVNEPETHIIVAPADPSSST